MRVVVERRSGRRVAGSPFGSPRGRHRHLAGASCRITRRSFPAIAPAFLTAVILPATPGALPLPSLSLSDDSESLTAALDPVLLAVVEAASDGSFSLSFFGDIIEAVSPPIV